MAYPIYNNPAYTGMQTIKQASLATAMQEIAAYVEKTWGLKIGSIGVSSAYRSPAQDRAVGGSGSGPHTTGKAVDFWLRSPEGKAYNSIYALCAAQTLAGSLGIKGIERITDGVSLHIDIGYRSSNWWAYQAKSGGRWVYYLVKDWYASSWAAAAGIKTPAASTTSKSRAVLKLGSKGSDVSDFERAINKAYNTAALTVDGAFGPACRRACIAFQRDRGLVQDGICGPIVWAQLEPYV
jgi:hypothetical protein